MKLIEHTVDQQPTFMRDVYKHLIGKRIVVFTTGHVPLGGVLSEFNGHVVHLTNENGGMAHTYLPADKIVAVSCEED